MTEGFADIKDRLSRLENLVQAQLRDYVLWRDFEHSLDQHKVEILSVEQQQERDNNVVRSEIRDLREGKADRATVEAIQSAQQDKSDKAFTLRMALLTIAASIVLNALISHFLH